MSSPKLFIRRVVVTGVYSYDQPFFPGLNIIHAIQTGDDPRSTNRCGKTSFVELVQHGLGKPQASKEKFHFAPILDKLKTLWLEIETSGGIYTLERSLQNVFSAIRLHQGPFVYGMDSEPAEVIRLDDASHALLALVGIPEVSVNTRQGDSTPLSFPLLMRAFILHQEDSFGEILFKVQPESRKADIIGFLTGITPLERFPLEEQIAEITQKLQPLENYLNQVTKFLLENNVPSLIEAKLQVERAQQELESAKEEQRSIQRDIAQQQQNDKQGHIDVLRHELLGIKSSLFEVESTYIGLQQEATRLTELIASLHNDQTKSKHLQASTVLLSNVEFTVCPRCLQEITFEMRQREQGGRCSLCSRPFVLTSDAPPKRVLKSEDIDVQLADAERVMKAVEKSLRGYERQLEQLHGNETEVAHELDAQVSAYVSPSVDRVIAQSNAVAERQANLTRALHLLEQAQALEDIQAQVNDLRSRLAELQDELALAGKARKQKREALRQEYAKILRAVDFPNFVDVSIDSQTLMPHLNDELYVHQGTALKGLATVCYHLALLALARSQETFFPKMLVIDSPNTGDLNEDNYTKLLKYIASLSDTPDDSKTDWQIILTTRYLPSELERFVRDRISNPNMLLLRKH